MSRTYKDRPIFIKIYEMMKKGEYDHMHDNFWRIGSYISAKTVEIPKKDAKEVYEFRNSLTDEGIEFIEEEVKAVRSLKRSDDGYSLVSYEVTPKMVTFTYDVEKYFGGRFSSYCTDVEYYDPRSQNDVRDNKTARCTPFPNRIGGKQGCGCCDCEAGNNQGKTKREATFKNIAKAFNNGADYDDLSDFENDSFWV